MHRTPHAVTLRMILLGTCCLCLAGQVPFVLGQTNIEADIPPVETTLHNLSPVGGFARSFFFFLVAALLLLVTVWAALRYRTSPNLYQVAADTRWDADAQADAGETLDVTEVLGACAALEHTEQPAELAEPPMKTEPQEPHVRVFTPASGAAWGESMLKAFLNACVKVNCLGRMWRESAARQVQSSSLPDPREAELIRRLMQRWQEFQVEPETGIFLEHASAAGRSRVCIISVTRDKHTLTQAAFNAGFVIESVGRYLRSTDLVYQRGAGDYHAPTKDELTAMTPGEKDALIRINEIPDPWQAMIGGQGKRNVGLSLAGVEDPASAKKSADSYKRFC